MQIVINIDDAVYKRAMVYKGEQFPDNDDLLGALITAVANGTPLPKGHGRLIDGDELESRMKIGYCIVRDAKTIIEADSEKE